MLFPLSEDLWPKAGSLKSTADSIEDLKAKRQGFRGEVSLVLSLSPCLPSLEVTGCLPRSATLRNWGAEVGTFRAAPLNTRPRTKGVCMCRGVCMYGVCTLMYVCVCVVHVHRKHPLYVGSRDQVVVVAHPLVQMCVYVHTHEAIFRVLLIYRGSRDFSHSSCVGDIW